MESRPPPRPTTVAAIGGLIVLLLLAATGWFILPSLPTSAASRLFVLALLGALGAAIGISAVARSRYERAAAAPVVFEAQVVRRWIDRTGETMDWFLSVDDGVSAKPRTWSVDFRLYQRFPEGSRVVVTTDARGRLMAMTGHGQFVPPAG